MSFYDRPGNIFQSKLGWETTRKSIQRSLGGPFDYNPSYIGKRVCEVSWSMFFHPKLASRGHDQKPMIDLRPIVA